MCEMIIRGKMRDESGVQLVWAYIPSVHGDRDPGHSLYHKEVIQLCIWEYLDIDDLFGERRSSKVSVPTQSATTFARSGRHLLSAFPPVNLLDSSTDDCSGPGKERHHSERSKSK